MNWKDAVIRAVRTFAQTAIGAFLATGALSSGDWTVIQAAGVSAGIAGLTALLSFVQNLLEDNTAVKTIK